MLSPIATVTSSIRSLRPDAAELSPIVRQTKSSVTLNSYPEPPASSVYSAPSLLGIQAKAGAVSETLSPLTNVSVAVPVNNMKAQHPLPAVGSKDQDWVANDVFMRLATTGDEPTRRTVPGVFTERYSQQKYNAFLAEYIVLA
jgi:hypothetical protein